MSNESVLVALITAIGGLLAAILAMIERRYRNSELRCEERLADYKRACDKEIADLKDDCKMYRSEVQVHEGRLEDYKLLMAEMGVRRQRSGAR